MPDECHDWCAPAGVGAIYYPFAWREGVAGYRCHFGHTWTCNWGHRASGDEPLNADTPQGEIFFYNENNEQIWKATQ